MPEYVTTYRGHKIYHYEAGEKIPQECYKAEKLAGYYTTLKACKNNIDKKMEKPPALAKTYRGVDIYYHYDEGRYRAEIDGHGKWTDTIGEMEKWIDKELGKVYEFVENYRGDDIYYSTGLKKYKTQHGTHDPHKFDTIEETKAYIDREIAKDERDKDKPPDDEEEDEEEKDYGIFTKYIAIMDYEIRKILIKMGIIKYKPPETASIKTAEEKQETMKKQEILVNPLDETAAFDKGIQDTAHIVRNRQSSMRYWENEREDAI